MKVQSITSNFKNYAIAPNYEQNKKHTEYKKIASLPGNEVYLGLINNINFTAEKQRSKVPNIDYFEYKNLSPNMKQILRKKYNNFRNEVKTEELKDSKSVYLPLKDDRVMKQFIDVCDAYRELRNEPILCLGRSPKWFLNTALWMKDGIDDYKCVAFSKYWYRNSPDGMVKIERCTPTIDEKKAYKRYLKRIQADPKHIVDVHKKTGKKIVITDYINSGKGACSFLDLMSEFAEEDGILDEFAKSIRIFGIGCMEYMENMYHDDENIPIPKVPLPERLWPYYDEIEQEFHDMPIEVFEQMLINENTNECRSSYYPHETWTVYQPNRFRTGMLSEKKLEELKKKCPRNMANYTTAMKDYRNLLNFRILDYLNENGLLREHLNSKQWD